MNDMTPAAPAQPAAEEERQESRALTPIGKVRAELDRMEAEIAHALPAHIPVDRFKRVVLTAIQSNPDLLEADRRSLWGACVKAAQDGLLPDGREGALVTFYDRRQGRTLVQWMPMVAGILKKARNSGEVSSITANVAYEGEPFVVVLGDDERIEHRRDLSLVGKAPPIAVYAIATLKDGTRIREVMTWEQVEDIRAISRSPDKGPWATWPEEMARKTVIRRLAKRLPMSSDRDEDLARVIERVDEQYEFARDGARRIEDAELTRRVEQAIGTDAADAAEEEARPARIVYLAANGKEHESPDIATWRADWLKRIKALVRDGREAELQECWERNGDTIAAVAEIAPLTADEIVQAIRDALGLDGGAPEPDDDEEEAAAAAAAPAEAEPAQPPATGGKPGLFIEADGTAREVGHPPVWVTLWRSRVEAFEKAGDRDGLVAAWERNAQAITDSGAKAPEAADEVIRLIKGALARMKPASDAPAQAQPAEQAPAAEPTAAAPDPFHVPLEKNDRGGLAWKPWADRMRVLLAGAGSPEEVNALVRANAEALALMQKNWPDSYASWERAVHDRLAAVAPASPPEPIKE